MLLPHVGNALSLLALMAPFTPLCQALWPVPQDISTGSTALFIDQTIAVTYNGVAVCTPYSSLSCPDSAGYDHQCRMSREAKAELVFNIQLAFTPGYQPAPGSALYGADIVRSAVSRSLHAIFYANFVPWKLRPRGSDFEPSATAAKTFVKTLNLTLTTKDTTNETFFPLAGQDDESYTLEVTEEGSATIEAASSTGLLRGLETFSQLFYQHSAGTFWYTQQAPVMISDKPRYSHRGLLLDVARNWFPVKDILRTIDAMGWNKLNRLHLHMTESQSWPLEIPSMPELAEKGAYAKGLTYTPADLVTIQEYCLHRGIEPIIEIDMPGHIGVVSLAYPDLIVAWNELPYTWYCAEPPCGALKLNSTAVYDFLDKLFADVLPRVAPYTAYFHTGGDEFSVNNSMIDDGILSNDTAVLQPLVQKFVDYVHGKVRDAGMTPMVWEEMPLEWNVTLGDDTIVQTWLGRDAVRSLVQAGHKVIDSNYNFWVSHTHTHTHTH